MKLHLHCFPRYAKQKALHRSRRLRRYLMQRCRRRRHRSRSAGATHGTAKILLLIGSGNNGADTIYAGARLSAKGHRVDAVIFDQRKNLELIARRGSENLDEHTLEPYRLRPDR